MKYMIRIIFMCLCLAPVYTFATTRDIYYGTKGNDVKAVQQFLKDVGIFKGNVTGQYYSVTQKAVVTFQKKYGVKSTGVVGKLTKAKMLEVYSQTVSQDNVKTSANLTGGPGTPNIVTTSSPSDMSEGTLIKTKIAKPNFSIEGISESEYKPPISITPSASSSTTTGQINTPTTTVSTSTNSVDSTEGIPAFDPDLEDRS